MASGRIDLQQPGGCSLKLAEASQFEPVCFIDNAGLRFFPARPSRAITESDCSSIRTMLNQSSGSLSASSSPRTTSSSSPRGGHLGSSSSRGRDLSSSTPRGKEKSTSASNSPRLNLNLQSAPSSEALSDFDGQRLAASAGPSLSLPDVRSDSSPGNEEPSKPVSHSRHPKSKRTFLGKLFRSSRLSKSADSSSRQDAGLDSATSSEDKRHSKQR